MNDKKLEKKYTYYDMANVFTKANADIFSKALFDKAFVDKELIRESFDKAVADLDRRIKKRKL